jgi:uncharacterized protein (DUF2141 family)
VKHPLSILQKSLRLTLGLASFLMVFSCARMGNPDGGWYDETPPHVVSTTPQDGGVNVKNKHIIINFNEYIKLDNPTENVVISPPQIESPEIKTEGKRISVKLVDSLKANTTYTIDFSNGISDNNEGNPLGNYTYSFSTGDHIDTLEVSGYVLEADNLEPVKGILVGLYSNLSDTAFTKLPMLRVSKTDSRGHFTIKGIAPGQYHIYALQDADGDYIFGQKSEMLAFDENLVEPFCRPDTRQDTTWMDSLHIASIQRVPYTHYFPDNLCLRAFNEIVTNRYFVKAERREANHFTLFYTYGDSILPTIEPLNFKATEASYIVEPSAQRDTITYWLRDTALVNQDTLNIVLHSRVTDSTGVLTNQADTLQILSKDTYAHRQKEQQRKWDEWKKQQDKKKRKGQPYDSIMPPEELKLSVSPAGDMDPDQNLTILSPQPLENVDTAHIHLYVHQPEDSLWYPERYELIRRNSLTYTVRAEWRPEMEYSFEVDSATFRSIYGIPAKSMKVGLKVRSLDSYATLLVTLMGMNGHDVVAELLNTSGEPIKSMTTQNGQAEFYYIKPGQYYLRIINDRNGNGKWDTGDYSKKLQPEEVYYYPEAIDCKAKWDVNFSWDPTAKPLYEQKPAKILKQKADKQKTIQHRNADRAKKLGIQYIPK